MLLYFDQADGSFATSMGIRQCHDFTIIFFACRTTPTLNVLFAVLSGWTTTTGKDYLAPRSHQAS